MGTELLHVDGRTDRLKETRKERDGQTSCNFAGVSKKIESDISVKNRGKPETSKNSPRNCLKNIEGKHEIKELQKTALMGTTQIRTLPV